MILCEGCEHGTVWRAQRCEPIVFCRLLHVRVAGTLLSCSSRWPLTSPLPQGTLNVMPLAVDGDTRPDPGQVI